MVSAVQQNVRVDRQMLRRLGDAVRRFFASEVGGRAMVGAGLLFVLLVTINGLNVVNSYVGRDFMTAIEQRDRRQFARMALFYVGVFGASTVAAVAYRFTEERLALLWRDWLTRRLVASYLDGRLYYHLQRGEGLANPDQRIADDVRSFTTSTLSLFLIWLNGTLTLVAFSGVLWTISRPLFMVAAGYAALGSLLAIALGRPLVRLNYDQADREAAFRAALVGVRANAEAIAIVDDEPRLLRRLRTHVDAITANLRRIIAVNRNLNFFTTGYNYMIQLLPALIVAPLFINGRAEFGVIPQSSMAFAHVVGAFSLIVTQFPLLSSYATNVARLSALVDAVESTATRPPGGVTMVRDDSRLAFEALTLRSPRDGRVLVRTLTASVGAGGRLLVRGPSDASAALLRAIVGLWETGDGCIVRPAGESLLVVPEDPYPAAVTLRELLGGSESAAPASDADVRAGLRGLEVEDIVARTGGLDAELPWDAASPEERRLLAIARALIARPRFAVLVHPADGLGAARTGAALAALAARGIGYVVLDEEALGPEHFDAVVTITADGAWTRTPA